MPIESIMGGRIPVYNIPVIDQVFDNSVESAEPSIAILDENTANQIAAGEVVERPASVVKELVENAIDAGARRITVELARSGKQMIRVTDDGIGMSPEDAILSLQRHATSKIRRAEDLAEIVTMGFRGEALPSIASVSRMTIATRLASAADDAPGTLVEVIGGSIERVSEIGARAGTSITVEDLFYNVPARFKFLKSDNTEQHHVLELLQRLALARPDIALKLIAGGSELFHSPGTGALTDVCLEVYGRSVARKMLEIEYDSGMSVQVRGMLGPPETLRGSRGGQHLFVNKRFVRDRAIARALEDGYRAVQTIHGMQFPIGVILVEVDPAVVDVNVSPTKTEVRFQREREVFSAVYRAVQQCLIQKGGLVAASVAAHAMQPESATAMPPREPSFDSVWRDPFERKGEMRPWSAPQQPRPEADAEPNAAFDPFDDVPGPSIHGSAPLSPASPPAESRIHAEHREGLRGMRIVGQTRNMYIVAQTDRSLLVIDQHIAHERVLYERLLSGQAERALALQHLVIPVPLDLGRREALVVGERLGDLARAGFVLEPFGADGYLVRAVPAQVAQKQSVVAVMHAIIDELVEKTVSRRLTVPAEEVLITASCKMAVKAGDPLTHEEMQALMDDLLHCDNPYTCPHGRPIIIEFANTDLDRKFGRI
jgi:DNA mismatch repair protein MutL